jgi:hypothetical protein
MYSDPERRPRAILRPLVVLLGIIAFMVVAGFALQLRRGVGGQEPPQVFDLSIDIPITDAGYGVVRVTTSDNLSSGEIRIAESDGLVLVDSRNESEVCGPCEWELYAAHPTSRSVQVAVELTGWLDDEELGHGTTWATPSPLPSAVAESIAVTASSDHTPDVVQIQYTTLVPDAAQFDDNATRDSAAGFLWTGEAGLQFTELAHPCPPVCEGAEFRQTVYALVDRDIAGTFTVLQTGADAPMPGLSVRRPLGWLAETASGEDWTTSWANLDIQTSAGFDREAIVPVVEMTGVTRGQEPEEFTLVIEPTSDAGPPSRFVVGSCDDHGRCIAGSLRSPILPFDWTATIHWAYFDEAAPVATPLVGVDITQ